MSLHLLACALGLLLSVVGGVAWASDAAAPAPAVSPSVAAPTAGPKLIVILPPDKGTNVDPRLGRVVLLASEPLAEAPSGTLVLEMQQDGAWVATAHRAKGDYDARTRQWRWLLSPSTLPENAELRLTLKPAGGKTAGGLPLTCTPVVWTFKTTSAIAARLQGPGKGCPVDVPAPGSGVPCPPSH